MRACRRRRVGARHGAAIDDSRRSDPDGRRRSRGNAHRGAATCSDPGGLKSGQWKESQ